MAELIKKTIKDKEFVMVKGAHLLYPKFMKAVPIADEAKLPPSKQTNWEYSVQALVDEDTADEWDEIFTNSKSQKKTRAEIVKMLGLEDGDEFPNGLDSKAKKFYMISSKQRTHYPDKKTKVMTPFSKELRPRAFELVDGKYKDITIEKEIGNGSLGEVIVSAYKNSYGTTPMLKGIKVEKLVAFGGKGGSSEDDASMEDLFGDVELAELPDEPTVSTNGTQSDDDSDVPDDLPEDDEAPFDLEEEDY